MKPLDDAIGLRALGLGAAMVDVLDGKIELIFVMLWIAAIFRAPIGKNTLQHDAVLLVEGQDPVVQEIGGHDRRLAIIELGEANLRIGIDEGLLIDAADAFQGAHIEGVLRAAIAGTFGFELALHFFLGFGLLERRELALSKDEAFLRHLCFEGLQPVLHSGEVVPAPDGADAERRDGHAAPQELVGDPNLTPGGLFDGKRHDGIFNFWRNPVLQDGLAP